MNELEIKESTAVAAPKKKSGPKPKAKVLEPIKTIEVSEVPTFINPEEIRRSELKAKIAAERARKSKLVTGKFLFNECPGGELKFCYREFPGDQLTHYVMRHDSIHTIPLGVAQHLNDRCSYNEYFHNLDNGKAVDAKQMYITSKVHRTSFIPLDFTADVGNHTGRSPVQVTNYNPLDSRYNLDAMGR